MSPGLFMKVKVLRHLPATVWLLGLVASRCNDTTSELVYPLVPRS